MIVKKMLVNPKTGKRSYNVTIQIDLAKTENFHWNTVYHVYNSTKDYHQLQKSELKNIVW